MSTATCAPSTAAAARTSLRQQLLFLYLTHPNPTAESVGWSLFDGTGRETHQSGDADKPPYASVVAAMRDGWRVIQVAQQHPAYPGMEHRTAYLPYEFILERLLETAPEGVDHE